MMLKELGTFVVFVGCLFAIVMAMGGCDETQKMVAPMVGGDGPDTTMPITGEPPEGMVLIPAGSFEMGNGDEEAQDNEKPVHTVHLDAFYMDAHEVTNAEYKAFVDANPQWGKDNIDARFHTGIYLHFWTGNDYPAGKADHPVADVSWYAAMAYAEWAGKRLPTEAEWEYAARGGLEGKTYPWGDDELTAAHANYGNNVGDTIPVGQYVPNGYGLYDMAGNVWEWCLDAYDEDFYADSPRRNPIAGGMSIQELRENFTTIPNDSPRVHRGGSWFHSASFLHVANRHWANLGSTVGAIGFRCVRDITPAPAGEDIPEADGVDEGEVAEEEVPADDIADDVGIEVLEGMVLIPEGSFLMGSEDGDADEQPVHTVHLDAFYMDAYEVTNAEFKAFVNANPQWGKDNIEASFDSYGSYLDDWTGTDFPAGKADHPVEPVSWYAAMAYAKWAGKRLPTEAEWEYAARGGLAGKTYPWGDDELTPAHANYGGNVGDTTPVGQYAPNGYGLYDMAGNVSEWCLDGWHPNIYAASDNRRNPFTSGRNPIPGGETLQGIVDNFTTTPTYTSRMLRGGNWHWQDLRVANRGRDRPDLTVAPFGFRCVKDVTR